MKYPTDTFIWGGRKIINSWIRTDSLEGLTPIIQVYGICFNEKEEILICKRKENWIIPGGHPKKNETIYETLKREMIEEVDVKVKDIRVLGVMMVRPVAEPEKISYQVRCVCNLEELLPQTPDPDNGDLWKRKFVNFKDISKYVKWGITGKKMFEDAVELE